MTTSLPYALHHTNDHIIVHIIIYMKLQVMIIYNMWVHCIMIIYICYYDNSDDDDIVKYNCNFSPCCQYYKW